MRYQGRIASWNEARGFGFITPEQNGAEQAINGARSAGLFVHVTALQFTLADAEPSSASSAAPSFRAASQPPRPTSTRERSNPYRRRKSSWSGKLIPLLVLVGLFSIYSRFSAESMAPLPVSSFNQEEVSTPQGTTFIRQCDGRQHCSQMTSCEEATWFLQHCPNTKMDGEGDGIPCENQWCGH
ncbi:excalibur calcium-binding domain-containing protein [Aeromonas veronii]|uniref:excalibur calcium-binding domain-containing protein n=1 Tax=Aeromonas veronii TaxID=654 RepID=UPI004055930C